MSTLTRSWRVLAPLSLAALLATLDAPAEEAPMEETIVGSGAHRYRWDTAWPKLPDGMQLGNTHGNVVVDRAGRIVFNTDSEHAFVVVEPDGTFVRSFGAEWKGGVHGMTLRLEGEREFLYIAHLGRHCTAKLDLEGKVEWTLGWPEESRLYASEAEFNPTAIAVRPDGGLYVADGYGKGWVHEYDAKRKWKRAFGGPGKEPGKMSTPHGLLLDATTEGGERLVVCDRENHRLQRFTLAGELADVVTAELRRPCSVARRGGLYAVADLTGRVTLIDAVDGELRVHLAEQPDPERRAKNGVPPSEWRPGEFLSPHGIAFGLDGALYVQDWNRHGRVTRLVPVE